jgi:hypothetical protein
MAVTTVAKDLRCARSRQQAAPKLAVLNAIEPRHRPAMQAMPHVRWTLRRA